MYSSISSGDSPSKGSASLAPPVSALQNASISCGQERKEEGGSVGRTRRAGQPPANARQRCAGQEPASQAAAGIWESAATSRQAHSRPTTQASKHARAPVGSCPERGRRCPRAPAHSSLPAPAAPPPAARPPAASCAPRSPAIGWQQEQGEQEEGAGGGEQTRGRAPLMQPATHDGLMAATPTARRAQHAQRAQRSLTGSGAFSHSMRLKRMRAMPTTNTPQ